MKERAVEEFVGSRGGDAESGTGRQVANYRMEENCDASYGIAVHLRRNPITLRRMLRTSNNVSSYKSKGGIASLCAVHGMTLATVLPNKNSLIMEVRERGVASAVQCGIAAHFCLPSPFFTPNIHSTSFIAPRIPSGPLWARCTKSS